MTPFLISALALGLALPPIVTLLERKGWIGVSPSFLFETTWLVSVFTIIIFVYLYRSGKRSFFVQLYLLSMAVKLVAYFAYNLIVILEDRKGAVVNVVYFLVVYAIFTVLEIAFLYRKISPSARP